MLKIYEGVENHQLYKVVDDLDILKEDDKTYLVTRTVFGEPYPYPGCYGCFCLDKVEVVEIARGE